MEGEPTRRFQFVLRVFLLTFVPWFLVAVGITKGSGSYGPGMAQAIGLALMLFIVPVVWSAALGGLVARGMDLWRARQARQTFEPRIDEARILFGTGRISKGQCDAVSMAFTSLADGTHPAESSLRRSRFAVWVSSFAMAICIPAVPVFVVLGLMFKNPEPGVYHLPASLVLWGVAALAALGAPVAWVVSSVARKRARLARKDLRHAIASLGSQADALLHEAASSKRANPGRAPPAGPLPAR